MLPFDVYITKPEDGRRARAGSLVVRLTYLDQEKGTFRGEVLSSEKGHKPYHVKIEAKERICSCECVDFLRRAQPCKHLVAFGAICRHVSHGISPGQLNVKDDVEKT